MKRFLPSTLLGKLVLLVVVLTVLYGAFMYFCFDLLVPTEWGGATQ